MAKQSFFVLSYVLGFLTSVNQQINSFAAKTENIMFKTSIN